MKKSETLFHLELFTLNLVSRVENKTFNSEKVFLTLRYKYVHVLYCYFTKMFDDLVLCPRVRTQYKSRSLLDHALLVKNNNKKI